MDGDQMREMDIAVTSRGVGIEVLERLSAVPFDGGEGGTPGGVGPDAFSPLSSFGSDSSSIGRPTDDLFTNPGWTDLDDFDSVEGAISTVKIFSPASGALESLDFTVNIEVRYVDQDAITGDWQPVTELTRRTSYKRALVTVDSPMLTAPLQIGRIYAGP